MPTTDHADSCINESILQDHAWTCSRSNKNFPSTVDQNARYNEMVLPDQVIFNMLLKKWHRERGATSSIIKMAMCPSYQKIIGMGDRALPLILHQLVLEGDEPDMWFWALRALTNADPVTEDIRGDIGKMAQAWVKWGRQKYAW